MLDGDVHYCYGAACERSGASKCARCHTAWYCGRECLRRDWPRHKPHCESAAAARAGQAAAAPATAAPAAAQAPAQEGTQEGPRSPPSGKEGTTTIQSPLRNNGSKEEEEGGGDGEHTRETSQSPQDADRAARHHLEALRADGASDITADPSRSGCAMCGKTQAPATDGKPAVKLRRCTGCETAWYCGKECQFAAWPAHKKACQDIKRLRDLAEKDKDAPATHTTRPWLQTFADSDLEWPNEPPPGISNAAATTLVRSPELRGLLPGTCSVVTGSRKDL